MKYNKKRQNIARKKRRVGAASAHPGRVRPHDPASGQSDTPQRGTTWSSAPGGAFPPLAGTRVRRGYT